MSFSLPLSLLLSILLTLASFLNLTAPLTGTLIYLLDPFTRQLNFIRGQEVKFFTFATGLPRIAAENAKLVNENNQLKVKLKKLSESASNQALVASQSQTGWKIQPLRLVNQGNFILFTASDFSALRPGQPVVSENTLLGLVKSVQPPIIKVTPLNHSEIKLAAQLETGSRGDFVYKDNSPHIVNLPTNIAFNSKTIVLTLPSDQIPENLLIGQVEKVTTNPASPTQEATVILGQESWTENVFVITLP